MNRALDTAENGRDHLNYGEAHREFETLLHDLAEVVLMTKDAVRHLLNMVQHTTFQNLYQDEVPLALAPVLLVQGAIKEVLAEVPVIGRTILHLGTAVSTVDHTREYTALACPGHAVTLAANLLNLFKHIIVNNAFMCVREDSLILHRIQPLLLVPDGVGVGLEVDRAASVLPAFQNAHDSAVLPRIGVFRDSSSRSPLASWTARILRLVSRA